VIEAGLIRRKIVEDLLRAICRKYCVDAAGSALSTNLKTIKSSPWKPAVHHLHAQRR